MNLQLNYLFTWQTSSSRFNASLCWSLVKSWNACTNSSTRFWKVIFPSLLPLPSHNSFKITQKPQKQSVWLRNRCETPQEVGETRHFSCPVPSASNGQAAKVTRIVPRAQTVGRILVPRNCTLCPDAQHLQKTGHRQWTRALITACICRGGCRIFRGQFPKPSAEDASWPGAGGGGGGGGHAACLPQALPTRFAIGSLKHHFLQFHIFSCISLFKLVKCLRVMRWKRNRCSVAAVDHTVVITGSDLILATQEAPRAPH